MQAEPQSGNRKPGVCYARTNDGLELPVIDITNPAFAVRLSDPEIDELLQKQLKSIRNQNKLTAWLQRRMLGLMKNRSLILRGLLDSSGTFMSGLNTYLMKLGPDNLDASYASDIDRQIAASLPVLSVRLRLQDVARLLAEGLVEPLRTDKTRGLRLFSIGGGPAIDSLNALLVLREDHSDLLTGRAIRVHSLDRDEAGPAFGARALSALTGEGGPLQGLDVRFEHVPYDWSRPEALEEWLGSQPEGIVAASSEGALFEYGSDEEIAGNLQTLGEVTPPDALVAGTVTRADETGRLLNGASPAAIRLRGLEAFEALARRAGWRIEARIDRPLSHDVRMVKVR